MLLEQHLVHLRLSQLCIRDEVDDSGHAARGAGKGRSKRIAQRETGVRGKESLGLRRYECFPGTVLIRELPYPQVP